MENIYCAQNLKLSTIKYALFSIKNSYAPSYPHYPQKICFFSSGEILSSSNFCFVVYDKNVDILKKING